MSLRGFVAERIRRHVRAADRGPETSLSNPKLFRRGGKYNAARIDIFARADAPM